MRTTHKIALAVTLLLGSSSIALAQGFDPNLGNRVPLLNEPGVYGYRAGGGGSTTYLLPSRSEVYESSQVGLATAPVGLTTRSVGLSTAPVAGGGAPAYGGPFREDAIALGMSRLYGARSYGGGYQSAPVGLYQGAPYGGYQTGPIGYRSAPVGLYQGAAVNRAARIDRRRAIRSAPVAQDYGTSGGY